MKQTIKSIKISTKGKNLYEITNIVNDFVNQSSIFNGLLNISILHTSASLIIQENADNSVRQDILKFFEELCPENLNYKHRSEGNDDMPAHLRSLLTQSNLTFSVINNKIVLGKWQGIFIFEHRENCKHREVQLHILGEKE